MSARLVALVALAGLFVAAAPVMPHAAAAAPAAMMVPTTTVVDLETSVHDIVIDGGSLWATLPAQNRAAELDAVGLTEQRRLLVGSSPRGIDVLDDGQLAIALYGATGYVELDPVTEALTTVTLPLLGAPQTWDVANIGDDKVLVSASPEALGSAYIVRVDRSNERSSTRVADHRIIRAGPVFADAASTVLVGEGFMPESLYRLDGTDPALPIVAEDNHGDVSGTQRLTVSPDGSRAYLASGQVVRTSDLTPIGSTSPGFPVVDSTGTTAYALGQDSATAFETVTYSSNAQYDLSGCGFTTAISAALMPTDSTIFAVAGTRICQITLTDAVEATDSRGELHPLEPTRILDTRSGVGGIPKVVNDASVQVAGQGGVPSTGASAVVMNVTVTEPTASSYLTVYPAGMPRPTASNLNYLPGETLANLVTVKLGENGRLALFNLAGSTHVIFDVVGWYSEVGGLPGARFHPMAPERFADTREDVVGALGPGEIADLQIAGMGSIPEQGVSAVVMNVTVTEPTEAGFLTVWPGGPDSPVPVASNVNFTPGVTRPNLAVVPVASDGWISFYNHAGSTHVLVDVVGWYDDGTDASATALRPLEPARLLDTRIGLGAPAAKLGAGTVTLQVTGRGGVPDQGVSAVILNVTAVQPSAGSFLTVWPSGVPRPTASNLNYRPGQVVPNLVVVMVGPGGTVDIANHFGEVHVVADVVGWFGPD